MQLLLGIESSLGTNEASSMDSFIQFLSNFWTILKGFLTVAGFLLIGAIYAVLAFVYGLLVGAWHLSKNYPASTAFVAIPIISVLGYFLYRSYLRSRRRKEIIRKAFEIIEAFSPVLATERKKMTYIDSYGSMNADKWIFNGIPYFVDRILVPQLQFPEGVMSIQSFKQVIGSYVDKVAIRTSVPNSSFNSEMSGQDYEVLCYSLLTELGWDSSLTPPTGDQGVDIIATMNGKTVCIQCKRYSSKVGNDAIQQVVAGTNHYSGTHSVVISNSDFTPQAKMLASTNRVLLIHHDDISRLDELTD